MYTRKHHILHFKHDFIECKCNEEGSKGCNDLGCICDDNVEGRYCDHCKDNFYDFPNCTGMYIPLYWLVII